MPNISELLRRNLPTKDIVIRDITFTIHPISEHLNTAIVKHSINNIIDGKENEDKYDILVRAIAEKVVVNWKNIHDENGNEIPYDPDLCHQILLSNPDITMKLIDEGYRFAEKVGNFTDKPSRRSGKK